MEKRFKEEGEMWGKAIEIEGKTITPYLLMPMAETTILALKRESNPSLKSLLLKKEKCKVSLITRLKLTLKRRMIMQKP